jgi:putative ATP-binding cassette transporter
MFLLRESRGLAILAVLSGLIAGVGNSGLLALINMQITNVGDSTRTLVWGYVGLCILTLASRVVSELILTRLSLGTMFDLRMKLSKQILAAPLRRLEELRPHRLLATLTQDIPEVVNALIMIPMFCMYLTIIIACLAYLAWLSWIVFLGVVAFIIVAVASYQLSVVQAKRYQKLSREEWDSLFKHLRALTDGTKELKLHSGRRQAFLSQVLHTSMSALRRFLVLANNIYAVSAGWAHLLLFILIGLIIFAVPSVRGIDPRILTGYTIIIIYIMGPIEFIIGNLPVLSRAGVAIGKIDELGFSLESSSKEAIIAPSANSETTCVSLKLVGVVHTYHVEEENNSFTLGPIDLTFVPGERVFLTGGNGSGKTTLAKLITGLYVPEAGEVQFNGEPVTDANRDLYRQNFTAVFSDYFLFESLLGLYLPELDAQARRYLEQLQLDHKVNIDEGRLSTLDLSQGQRKRLAMLTAYLENRSIYLFDEWASDQDPMFKEIFYYQILPELKARGKTVIVISHDDRYYHVADRILKLENGKLAFQKDLAIAAATPTDIQGQSIDLDIA